MWQSAAAASPAWADRNSFVTGWTDSEDMGLGIRKKSWCYFPAILGYREEDRKANPQVPADGVK